MIEMGALKMETAWATMAGMEVGTGLVTNTYGAAVFQGLELSEGLDDAPE